MEKKEFIEECKSEFNIFSNNVKNAIIDTLMFGYLVDEDKIPALIRICNQNNVERFDLIDSIKDEMVEVLLEVEQPAKVEEVLEREVEMIPVDFLVSRIRLENKRLILLNIFKEYPAIMKPIWSKAVTEANLILCQEFQSLLDSKGSIYEKCIDREQ